MIEVKLSFNTTADAIAFLAGVGVTSAAQDPVGVPEVKAPKSPKTAKVTDSAQAAETASVVVESKPAAALTPTPAATPSPTPPVTPAMEYATSDLPTRIAALVTAQRSAEVKAVLAKFGAKKGPEVPAEKLHEFAAAIKAIEDNAPEESLG